MTTTPTPTTKAAAARRILVIDDEHGIRSLCGEVLKRAGYAVEVPFSATTTA